MKDIIQSTNINNGLNKKEVINNRTLYGKNVLDSKENESFIKLFIESLGDPIIRILLIALGIKTVFLISNFDWYETVGIVVAILIASLISTVSEYGSQKAFERLQEESSKIRTKVIRNKKIEEIKIDEVVIGDIVVLSTGDKIPADGILVKGSLTVDESSLNGETKEREKVKVNNYLNKYEDKNYLYRGTVCYSGEGVMLVTRVGMNTFYGKLASEIQEKEPDSPLKIRLRELATVISRIGYISAILVAISYLFSVVVIQNNFDINKIINMLTNFSIMSGHILHALTLSVTIIVVCVPEGLPMMITLVLSSNMKRMLKNNVLVRKLVGIETSGSLNILFTDKTGTLTKGKLEVVGVVDGKLNEYNSLSDLLKYPKFYNIFSTSCVYNNASIYDEEKSIAIGGNITDRALLSFVGNYKSNYNKIDSVPFDSKNKYSVSTISDGIKKVHLIKGAPEKIIPYCNKYYNVIGSKDFILKKEKIYEEISKYTKMGIRVLALATSSENIFEFKNLCLVGIVLIKDEVRTEAIKGVQMVNKAHIQTVMITGDNKDTAISIAKEVGILKNEEDIVLTSSELENMKDEELKNILPKLRVVARSLPQDKSRLVRIAQSKNLVVGMTGDGVNDAPALKKADVGFAMGSGTEVAKEASDIVILDDNFNSIFSSILFGRTIFKSIRKFIIFQLTVNLCAVSLSILGPFIKVPNPVTIIQMLWINMVMDTFAGLAYSYEPPLEEYMEEYPKKKNESILNRYMIGQISFTGIYSSLLCVLFLKSKFISSFYRTDSNNIYLMTAFFGLFIFISIFNSFNARTNRLNLLARILKNKVFLVIIGIIIIVQMYMLYYGGNLFRTRTLNFKEFIVMMICSTSVIPIDFIRKVYLRYRGSIGGV